MNHYTVGIVSGDIAAVDETGTEQVINLLLEDIHEFYASVPKTFIMHAEMGSFFAPIGRMLNKRGWEVQLCPSEELTDTFDFQGVLFNKVEKPTRLEQFMKRYDDYWSVQENSERPWLGNRVAKYMLNIKSGEAFSRGEPVREWVF